MKQLKSELFIYVSALPIENLLFLGHFYLALCIQQEKTTRLNDVPKKNTRLNINVNKKNMRISNKKKEWCQQPKQQGSRRSLNIFLPCRHNGHDRRDGNKCKEKTRISQECLFISEQRMKSNSIQHKDQAENIRLKCQL